MTQIQVTEKTISCIFQEEAQAKNLIERLIDRGISRENISVMGKNFESQTRIAGFITKKDVILGGLRQGAIFGSLFGSLLSLLTGVGVLFIPFVGSVVAAGPLSSILLGAATGALAGGAGAGLASALTTLGMSKDKAAVYETRVKAGEFLCLVEVPAEKSGEYRLLVESAGGEEIHVSETTLPRPCDGKCNSAEDLIPQVRNHLSEKAQQTFIDEYNKVLEDTNDQGLAEEEAWQKIHSQYEEDESGIWFKEKTATSV